PPAPLRPSLPRPRQPEVHRLVRAFEFSEPRPGEVLRGLVERLSRPAVLRPVVVEGIGHDQVAAVLLQLFQQRLGPGSTQRARPRADNPPGGCGGAGGAPTHRAAPWPAGSGTPAPDIPSASPG